VWLSFRGFHFAGFGAVHPPIAYAKLKSMAQGAEMASKELWK
jgi:hypothetical protein